MFHLKPFQISQKQLSKSGLSLLVPSCATLRGEECFEDCEREEDDESSGGVHQPLRGFLIFFSIERKKSL
jgi:hypothetical protein